MPTLWQRAQHGWPASYPLVQLPNPPLAGAFAALLVAAVTDGSSHDYARGAFYALLAAWAWLELSEGANAVRRIAGAIGLVYVVIKLGEAIGA